MDLWRSPEILLKLSDYHVRDNESPYKFKNFTLPFKLYGPETLDEGMVYSAEAGLYGSAQAYAKVLQAVINKDPRIMSPATWELSFKDDLGPRGLKLPHPELKSMLPILMNEYASFFSSRKHTRILLNYVTALMNLARQLLKMVME